MSLMVDEVKLVAAVRDLLLPEVDRIADRIAVKVLAGIKTMPADAIAELMAGLPGLTVTVGRKEL